MSDTTPRLDLPLLQPAQAQKHVTHNEAISQLDVAVQLTFEAMGVSTPPAEPAAGQCWAIGSGAVGLWQGQDGKIGAWVNSGWLFVSPAEGWRGWDKGTGALVVHDGGAWMAAAGGAGGYDNLNGLGVNTSSDATNRLAVASDAALFTHDGTDHRLTVNKAGLADTASLVFQSGYSGRAEMGLTGEDAFSIKVSADGSAFTTALSVDPATGLLSGAAVQSSANDATAGRIMRADWGLLRSDIAGTVTESGGVPSGAVIEQGSTANGSYTRFADGTQICARRNWLPDVGGSTWVFPRTFIDQTGTSVIATSTNTSAARFASALSTSAADAQVRVFDTSGTGVSSGVTTVAYGRWF